MIMLKKWLVVLAVFILAISAVGCGSEETSSSISGGQDSNTSEGTKPAEGAEAKKEEPIEVRLAHNMPETHFTAEAMKDFAKAVNQKSNGRLNVSVFPAGQLYDDKTMGNALTKGSVEMGMNTLTMWAGLDPKLEVYSIPFLMHDLEAVHKATDNGLGDMLSEDMEKLGAKPLIWVDYGFGYHASNEKPLTGKENFEGMKVRTLSKMGASFLEFMGAAPVTMGGAEVEQALQRGTIDGAVSGVTSFVARKYYEVAEYVVADPLSFGMFVTAVNKDWFNNLPKDLQEVLNEAAKETQDDLRETVAQEEKAALEELEKKGMKIVHLNEKELAEVKEARDVIIKEYIERTGDRGKEIIDVVMKNAN
jgi:tripartite ATP-independent transporter DctP family solute receptor